MSCDKERLSTIFNYLLTSTRAPNGKEQAGAQKQDGRLNSPYSTG